METILAAVDGSADSEKALAFACELADRFDCRLHIVHVPQGAVADRAMVLGGASIMLGASREEIEAAGRSLVAAAKEMADDRTRGEVTAELRGGDPASEIVAAADESGADCIVVGSRGLGNFGSFVLGSVSDKVNHSASCTCITVR
jgi:nucleotide-binding universal stress UspA family protein